MQLETSDPIFADLRAQSMKFSLCILMPRGVERLMAISLSLSLTQVLFVHLASDQMVLCRII